MWQTSIGPRSKGDALFGDHSSGRFQISQRGHRAPDELRNRAHDAARLDGREPILGMLGLACPILRDRFSKLLHLITDISLVLRSIDQVETGWR
jgi:hypothetical protein